MYLGATAMVKNAILQERVIACLFEQCNERDAARNDFVQCILTDPDDVVVIFLRLMAGDESFVAPFAAEGESGITDKMISNKVDLVWDDAKAAWRFQAEKAAR